MTQADSVHSTPRITAPKIDPTRRQLLTIAAGGAVAAAMPTGALATVPAVDPIFAAIAGWQAAYDAHGAAITKQDRADSQFGFDSPEAFEADERCEAACHAAHEAGWTLARITPTTLAGVAAVLRFANKIEDEGMEWPSTGHDRRRGLALSIARHDGRSDRDHHSQGSCLMAEIFKFPGSSSKRERALAITAEPDEEERWRSRPYTRRGPNMQTFLFRSYNLIVESEDADLVRDVCIDVDKAQTKLKALRRRLKGVQEQAAAQIQLLTTAETKLSSAIVAALLKRGQS